MPKYTLSYTSNNSGGSWWLTDEDWKKMEEAGWKVRWMKDENDWQGKPYKDGRWLGALAKHAEIETDDPKQTIREWESITGQSAADQGCNCCGAPHYFSWVDEEGKYSSLEVHHDSYWD